MNSMNKVELVKIPAEVDSEDLKIVFESNAFGYQTVIDVQDKPLGNSKLKNVIIELESAEAAKQVAKSAPFSFNFGSGEVLIRPVLYFDNIASQHKPNQEVKPEKTFKKELAKLYTCWIGNIPNKYAEDKLEDFFTKQVENNSDKYHSIKLIFIKKHNKYQCFINLYSHQEAESLAQHFNGSKMDDSVLEACLRGFESAEAKIQSQSDSESDSSEFDQETSCAKTSKEGKFQKIFRISKSKNLKALIKKQIDEIKLSIGDDILVNEEFSRKGNLSFRVVAPSEAKLSDALAKLKSKLNVIRKKIKFSEKEYAQIQNLKSQLIQIKPNRNKEFFNFYLEDRSKCVVIEFLDTGDKALKRDYFKYLNQIEKFCDEKIESQKEISICGSDHLEFFKICLKNTNDLKYNFISKNGTNFRINLFGKKINLDKFNWPVLAKQIKVVKFDNKIKNKSVISYINYKMRHFKSEFEKIGLVLLCDKIEANSDTLSLKIVSTLDSKELQTKVDEIFSYFDKTKLLTVNFENATAAKQIEKDVEAMNLPDLDLNYRDDKKKFFINSADQNALNLVKLIIESKRFK